MLLASPPPQPKKNSKIKLVYRCNCCLLLLLIYIYFNLLSSCMALDERTQVCRIQIHHSAHQASQPPATSIASPRIERFFKCLALTNHFIHEYESRKLHNVVFGIKCYFDPRKMCFCTNAKKQRTGSNIQASKTVGTHRMDLLYCKMSHSTTDSRRLRRRISRRHGWNISDCRLLCTLLVLFRSTSFWLPQGSTSTGCTANHLLPFLPVACAAEVSLRQQPTKDLDDQDKNGSSNSSINREVGERPSSSTTTQIRTSSANDRLRPSLTLNQLLRKAGKKGLGGGIPGFIAGVCQVGIVLCCFCALTITF